MTNVSDDAKMYLKFDKLQVVLILNVAKTLLILYSLNCSPKHSLASSTCVAVWMKDPDDRSSLLSLLALL